MTWEALSSCHLCGSDQLESWDAEAALTACRGCGHVFANPRPSAEAIARFYSQPQKYDAWLSRARPRQALWKRRLRKMRTTRRPGGLLDVGTGTGLFLHQAQAHYTPLLGTEISDRAIEIAKSRYHLAVLKGDILDIQFDQPTGFENITLFHTLEHLPNPKEVIEKCRALLRDDGVLVIAVPNDLRSWRMRTRRWIKRLLKRVGLSRFRHVGPSGFSKIQLDGSADEIHLSHFTPNVLRRLLEGAGFRVIQESLDPYFAGRGPRLLLHHLWYLLASCVMAVFRTNIYDTIWMVATKEPEPEKKLGEPS